MSEATNLHLRPLPEQHPARIDVVYLVIAQDGPAWSQHPAKIVGVFSHEGDAEAASVKHKLDYPRLTVGVFELKSEARSAAVPIEIARAGKGGPNG